MRKMKKFLCAALTTTMVLAMAAPSFADTTTPTAPGIGTLTITRPSGEAGNVDKTHTYHVYQLFTVESYIDDDHYAYKVVDAWKTFFESQGWNINEEGYLISRPENDEVNQVLAKAALEYAKNKNNNISVTATLTSNAEGVATDNLVHGYYLIDSTVGTLCVLDTNTLNIVDKNVAPSITKTVNDDDKALQIGEDARYTITVTAQPNTNNYVIHDNMSSALSLVENSVEVKLGQQLLVKGTDYTLDTAPVHSDTTDCTFEIKLADSFNYASITEATDIVVTYSAELNANVLENDVRVTNTAHLTYGDGEKTPDTPDVPELYTYQFDLQKIDATKNADGSVKELNGAEFELYTTASEGTAIQFVAVDDTTYRVATEGEINNANVTTTSRIVAGNVKIKGLDNTTYYLEEKVAPTGYNLLDKREPVTPARKISETLSGNPESQIENSTGTILPSTGGIGTTIFYAAGIILMAGAVFFVVRRKKA